MLTARNVAPEVGFRLSGLADGEACFSIASHPKGNYHCAFVIRLREDDRGVLERFQEALGGIGTIRRQPRRNGWAPTVTWTVADKQGVGLLRDLFALYPLWSKKARDCALWCEAVDFWLHCVGYGTDWTPVADLKTRLHEVRRFAQERV